MEQMDKIKKINMLLYGYDLDSTPIKIEHLCGLAYALSKIELDNKIFYVKKMSKWKMKKNVSAFLGNKIKIKKVRYLNDLMLFPLVGKTVKESELVNFYNQASIDISPFLIPLYFILNNLYGSKIEFHQGIYDSIDFYKNMLLAVNYIDLGKDQNNITERTAASYAHEIMHTQLLAPKGKIKDYNNSEVLSIFIELLYCYERDSTERLLRNMERQRINYFLYEFHNLFLYYYENDGTISEYSALKTSKYVNSILKAFQLFRIYYYGNLVLKKEILLYIQLVIDGVITLEEMLSHFEIGLESEISESILKYIKR